MAKQGKRLRDLRAKIDPEKAYPLDDAIALVKKGGFELPLQFTNFRD